MEVSHQIGQTRIDQRPHDRLHEGAIEREVGFRHAVDRRETALVGNTIAAKRTDVVERSRLAAHHPIAGHEVRTGGCLGLRFENRLIETGRQRIDQIDIA
jgi:hypothetical protein